MSLELERKEKDLLARLESLGDPANLAGMARFGITPQKSFGLSIPELRRLAEEIGPDHALAQRLWSLGVRETQILASLIDRPELVTAAQMERWAGDFDYWEMCDQCCQNLFGRALLAWAKAREWAVREEEFVKRAGFVLMARLAVIEKKAPDEAFEIFLPLIKKEAADGRRNVKKGVSWALRQIGKRNKRLHELAVRTAEALRRSEAPSARWIAGDALRELQSEKIKARLLKKAAPGR